MLLLQSERHTIDNLWLARIDGPLSDTEALEVAFRLRVRRLAAIEHSLAALPMLTGIALGDLPMASAAMRPFHEIIAEGVRHTREVA